MTWAFSLLNYENFNYFAYRIFKKKNILTSIARFVTFGRNKSFTFDLRIVSRRVFARTARNKPVVAPDARRTDRRKWASTGYLHGNVFPPLLAAFPAPGVPMVSDMLMHHDSAVNKDRLSGNKSHPVSQTVSPPFPLRSVVAAPTYENPANDHQPESDTQQQHRNQAKIIGKEVRVRWDTFRGAKTGSSVESSTNPYEP